MSLFIANGNSGGGRILYTNPTRNHPYSHIPYRPQFLSPLRRSTDDHDLHVVSASNKKLSSSRIGKFDSKNRRSSSTTTKEQEEVKRVGGGGEVETVNTSVVDDFDYGIDLPKLPGDEPNFWEGPQWDGLGFFVQYLWAFGIVFAVCVHKTCSSSIAFVPGFLDLHIDLCFMYMVLFCVLVF